MALPPWPPGRRRRRPVDADAGPEVMTVVHPPFEATLTVVVQRLEDLRADMRQLRADLQAARDDVVSRGEWVQRNITVDSRFESQGREIAGIKHAQAAARAPWWAWLGPVVALGALLYTVLGP